MADKPTIGVVVPAYRPDLDVLPDYLDRISETLDPASLRVELDMPSNAVREHLARTPATVAVSTTRRGKGGAITDGFDALDTDVLAFVDADAATPAPELRRIIAAVTGGEADLGVGSRRHPDATVETDQSPGRSLMGDGFAWLARRLLDVPLYDYQCGAKALTTRAWQQVRERLTERGFAWDIELVAFVDARGLQVQEVPITWHDHPESTVPPARTALELGNALVRTRYRTRRDEDAGPLSAGFATLRPSKRNE